MIVIHPTGERRPTASLVPYAQNSRVHSEAQIEEIVESMQQWGFTNSILIDPSGEIIAGHGRVEAARRLGLQECPVVVATGWSDVQRRAYVIADNKLGLNSTWDEAKLAAELEAIAASDFDLELVGFSDDELLALSEAVTPPPEREKKGPDAAPAPLPERSTARRGDIWTLGRHRVAVGDPREDAVLDALLLGKLAHAVVMAVDREADAVGLVGAIESHSAGWVFVWIDWRDLEDWTRAARPIGPPTSLIVWPRRAAGLGDMKRTFANDFELGLAWHRGAELVGRRIGSVWKVPKDPTVGKASRSGKPVGLALQAIEKTTVELALVLDLAGRDGSTLIACEKSNRAARVVESDGRFVDVMLQRWQEATGGAAILEASGQTFAEVAAERRPAGGPEA